MTKTEVVRTQVSYEVQHHSTMLASDIRSQTNG